MNSVKNFLGAAGLVNLGVLLYGVAKKNTTAQIVGGALVAANLLLWTKAADVDQGISLFGYFTNRKGNGGTGPSPGGGSVAPQGNGNTGPSIDPGVTDAIAQAASFGL